MIVKRIIHLRRKCGGNAEKTEIQGIESFAVFFEIIIVLWRLEEYLAME
jgi:hypothetical protein